MKQSDQIQDKLTSLRSQRISLLAKIDKCDQDLQETHSNIARAKGVKSPPSYVQTIAFNAYTRFHLPTETKKLQSLEDELFEVDKAIKFYEDSLERSITQEQEEALRNNFNTQVHSGFAIHEVKNYPDMEVVRNKLLFSVRLSKFDNCTAESIAKEMGSDPSLNQVLNQYAGRIHTAYRKGPELFIVPASVESRLSPPPSPVKNKV
jgi:hypothetical protein